MSNVSVVVFIGVQEMSNLSETSCKSFYRKDTSDLCTGNVTQIK